MKVIIIVLLSLVTISCTNDEVITRKAEPSLLGEWTFQAASVSGEFTIENINNELSITSGTFVVNGGVKYSITKPTTVDKTKLIFQNSKAYLALLKCSVSSDYNTITSLKLEYDTETTPTIGKDETVIITRKL
jgi:hypothetical protein